jgi:hypothetical protein
MSTTIAIDELTFFEAMRQIIIHEMGLADDRVNIFNQRYAIPADDKIFVVLECLPSKILSNRSRYAINAQSGDYEEIQDLTIREEIVVGIYSKNMDALKRKEEVIMAMSSHYAQQVQEQYSFKIFRDAPVQDLSVLEGAALLYRYDIPFILLTWTQRVTKVDFFDTFKGEVKVNDGLPIVTKSFDQPTS